MKKVFMLLIVMIFGIVLVGCNSENDKVNVDFRVGGTSNIVKVNKGSIISKDSIPLKNKGEVVELYYDEAQSKTYNDEPMNEDSIMYIKIIIDNLEKYLEKNEVDDLIIKKGYCNYVNKILNTLYEPNDFNIKYYLGQLTDNKYVVVMENDIRAHIMQFSNISSNWYHVGLVNFKYLPEIISIIFDGKYYDICEAYESKIISIDDVKIIKQIYDIVVIE